MRMICTRLLVVLCMAARPAAAQMRIVPDPARSVYVTGRGVMTVAPDIARVDLGVYVLDLDLARGKASADGAIGRLLALASSLGVPDADLKSASVYVSPRYDEKVPLKLIGYEITRSLTVTLNDLSRLELLLDGAIKAGSNRDFDVTLATSHEPELRNEALSRAIEDAKAQASFAAQRVGAKLGGVRSINLNNMSSTSSLSAFSRGETFLPGEVKVSAEAAVNFYLKDEGE